MLRGVRGATTVEQDSPEEIYQATRELLLDMLGKNGIEREDIASVFFSTTPDLRSAFPARAARDPDVGFEGVPLMGMQESPIEQGLPRCIRILIHWNSEKQQRDIVHSYLRAAQKLRPDLSS